MALVPVVQYTLNFDTNAGQSIEYELDIRRTYDDQNPDGSQRTNAQIAAAYDWITLSGGQLDFPDVIPLIGTGEPIEIEWERDYDVYKPILGSKAKLNLLIQNAGQYADFNDAGPYEYQVRLRYKDSSDVFQDYWRGYMTALDGQEDVTTFPFAASYSATDGLGLLEDGFPPVPTGTTNVKPFDSVLEALIQTGLGIDVLVAANIVLANTTTQALPEVTLDPQWVYTDSDKSERVTNKELIEGVLSAFNCTVKQSLGKWYITNASTYGTTTDSVEFEEWTVLNNVYIKSTNTVTENVQMSIGPADAELQPANEDLVLNTRRPYGSVECKPDGLYSEDIRNGGFEVVDASGVPAGWNGFSLSTPLETSNTVRLEGLRSITTNRSRFAINAEDDQWFESDPIPISGGAPIEVSFDWLGQLLIDSGGDGARNVRLHYRLFFVPDVTQTLGAITVYNPGVYTGVSNFTAGAYYYQPNKQEWRAVVNKNVYHDVYNNTAIAEGEDLGVWLEESTMAPPVRAWDYNELEPGAIDPGAGKLYVRFTFPRGNRPVGRGKGRIRGDRVGTMRAYVDNVSVQNMYESEITAPTFERIQENFTSTYTYEPRLVSVGPAQIIQLLDQQQFQRDNIISGPTETLEEIGTQLKLNDFRSQFKYYEGSLINLGTTPVAPHNKINVDWASVGYTETQTCIINGGAFKVKSNEFEVAMYVPNQYALGVRSDIASGDGTIDENGNPGPGFYNMDVDLVPAPFPGESNKRTYRLDVRYTSADVNGVTVVDGLIPDQLSYEWTGVVGDQIQVRLAIDTIAGYAIVVGPNTTGTAPETDDTPVPVHLTDLSYTNSGGQLRVNGLLTIPEDSEFETLHITAVLKEFDPETPVQLSANTITITNNVNGSIGFGGLPTIIPVTAPAFSVVQVVYNISSVLDSSGFAVNDLQTLDEDHMDESLKPDVAIITGDGTPSATFKWNYTVPAPDDMGIGENVDVTVTGSTTPITALGVDVQTKNVIVTNVDSTGGSYIIDGTEVTPGVPNVNMVPFTGVVGDRVFRNINIDPNDNKFIQDGDVTVTSALPTTDIFVVGPITRSGEDFAIPIEVLITAAGVAAPTLNIATSTVDDPYSLTFNVNSSGVANAVVSQVGTDPDTGVALFNNRQPFNEALFGMDIEPFDVVLTPTGNNRFVNPTDILIDIDEANVVTADGTIIELPKEQFSIGVPVINTSTGAISFTVGGDFPSMGGQYTLDINIIGNIDTTTTGGATLQNATAAGTSITRITPGISAGGGVGQFRVVANGSWVADVEINSTGLYDGVPNTRTSETGSFEETYIGTSPISGVTLSFTQRGSISAISGVDGTSEITLTAEGIGYNSDTTPPYDTSINPRNWEFTYTVRLFDPSDTARANPLSTDTIAQNGSFGTHVVVFPGFTDTNLSNRSRDPGASNLTFFG